MFLILKGIFFFHQTFKLLYQIIILILYVNFNIFVYIFIISFLEYYNKQKGEIYFQ